RPRLTLKLALSLDGRIATASGESQWITGPAARRHVHADRLRHDAVMVGGGTARTDDPALTVRGFGDVHQPVRVIASSKLNFEGAALKAGLPDAPVWMVHGDGASVDRRMAWTDAGADLIEVPSMGNWLDIPALLQALGAKGLTSVYCEGGGSFAASLLAAGLVDDLIVYHAGLAIGAEGLPGLGALEQSILANCARFDLQDHRRVGPDLRQHWTRQT
ncbi:MAG: RibD family protein, partial [Planktomarina sp.]